MDATFHVSDKESSLSEKARNPSLEYSDSDRVAFAFDDTLFLRAV